LTFPLASPGSEILLASPPAAWRAPAASAELQDEPPSTSLSVSDVQRCSSGTSGWHAAFAAALEFARRAPANSGAGSGTKMVCVLRCFACASAAPPPPAAVSADLRRRALPVSLAGSSEPCPSEPCRALAAPPCAAPAPNVCVAQARHICGILPHNAAVRSRQMQPFEGWAVVRRRCGPLKGGGGGR